MNLRTGATRSSLLIVILLLSCSYYVGPRQELEKESNVFIPYVQDIPESDAKIKMVPVPGGTFMMGSPETEAGRNDNEGPQRLVKVDSFWMGAYELSWDQYDPFLEEKEPNRQNVKILVDGKEIEVDAISTATPMYMDMSFGMGRGGFPAVNMTQYAAIMYAKWLFAKTGVFYLLPTEAEWEYACRAGTNSAYNFGENSKDLDKYAWFKENSGQAYRKVGTKEPNSLGLYDMHGNVAEWTMDQYLEDYHEQLEGNPSNNPYFKPTTLYPRSVRGGSWMDDGSGLRCASRAASSKKWKQRDPQMPKSLWWLTDAPFVGFRLVRPKETPTREEMEKYWIEVMEDF
ncbi:formylglycine-generating enzyme family protein [Antarcticibacterium sp. 1MA-6-2]|uniref:formylglycine-generating enzyme family protein n=1 Tax=Antarcticibacterium sp. 1MA-6-2 TaxID=2908210 RepID=UPI001F3C9527|nr:SUMF1/EgtB/PvdO family nonheme iron enzyme [Antarcticibacterium sp. 1MA-6-2]UJH90165.1 formylglycine-generating enzyme family protein [Antarcticibacterium sp. 1MA-6-2]